MKLDYELDKSLSLECYRFRNGKLIRSDFGIYCSTDSADRMREALKKKILACEEETERETRRKNFYLKLSLTFACLFIYALIKLYAGS